MGCIHTTLEVHKEEEPETGSCSAPEVHKVVNVKSTKCIDLPHNHININMESVGQRALAEKGKDGVKSNALLNQSKMLTSVHSVNTGSTLSLSDLATYQRKKFPKFRGYRKCKYCMQSESLPSSFKHTCDSVDFEVKPNESESESKVNDKDVQANNIKNVPRGLPTRDSCRRCSTKIKKNNSPNNFSSLAASTQFVNILAINALDLTAPASDALLKNRKNAWVQLAGHPGSFAPAGPDTIWKKRLTKDNSEVKAYQALMNDAARDVVPTFYREVEFNGDFFIEMEDLLHHFHDPNIMDIKMGCRTFLEAEVKNPVLRSDLYEKMMRLDPEAPSTQEHTQKAITKLRYMQFRENESSTASLGFRLEAIRVSAQTPMTDLKKVKTKEDVGAVIARFINGKENTRKSILEKLTNLRKRFEESEYFIHHELIGSSLLVMFDKRGTTGIWMIDFAKTMTVDQPLTHRAPWVVGNHEDGYLTGLDNLIQVFETMQFPSNQGLENLSFSPEQSTSSNDVT